MSSGFVFCIWGLIITQMLSSFLHSLSFFAKPRPKNETERQLIDLSTNYKADMGGGIKRSLNQLFIGLSTCFTMIYLLGAALNWYFVKTGLVSAQWNGLLMIQMIAYGILFLLMIKFTFWPPIIVTGLVFIFTIGSWLTI